MGIATSKWQKRGMLRMPSGDCRIGGSGIAPRWKVKEASRLKSREATRGLGRPPQTTSDVAGPEIAQKHHVGTVEVDMAAMAVATEAEIAIMVETDMMTVAVHLRVVGHLRGRGLGRLDIRGAEAGDLVVVRFRRDMACRSPLHAAEWVPVLC
uniref:Uncharacterized protein n=1 Tax=Eutreptiella gymnastica TaxID=73025 RepID=A0A7S4G3F7_9EUGL